MLVGAEHEAVVPPLMPLHFHTQLSPERVTVVAVPFEQRPVSGAQGVVTPFAEPHTPFTAVLTVPTLTVAVLVTEVPALFTHLSVYVVLTVGLTVTEPLVLMVPVYGLSVQDVAPDVTHVSVDV
jgi:hypothetical protein